MSNTPRTHQRHFRLWMNGLAQASLVEHSLCQLNHQTSLQQGLQHESSYQYTDKHRNRRQANVSVTCPFGLSANDELYLYGLLALTFSQPEPTPDFYATPHYCLKQLGIVGKDADQGNRYATFRQAIRRLAGVIYENDAFYDPIRGEHRDVAFGFLKYSLPTDPESSRAWHFVWDQQFFRFCEAMAGSFQFDFTLYRSLDVASRRLFLLLQKMFWRREVSPAFELRHLGIEVLGFSPTLRTTEIKRKLARICEVLLERDVIALPLNAEVRDLFTKQRKGVHTLTLHRGAYFTDGKPRQEQMTIESPLVEPLTTIGLDARTIQTVLKSYRPSLLQQWADITLAAMEQKRIRQTPQAFFMHHIKEAKAKRTTPPDWWREYRKQEFTERQAERSGTDSTDEDFEAFLRHEAQEAFQRITSKLRRDLQQSGQTDDEAQANAEYAARMHLRRQFHERQSARPSGMESLGDIVSRRQT